MSEMSTVNFHFHDTLWEDLEMVYDIVSLDVISKTIWCCSERDKQEPVRNMSHKKQGDFRCVGASFEIGIE